MRYICPFCGSSHPEKYLADLCEEQDILNETIRHIVYSFGECNTTAEVNDLVNANIQLLNDHPKLFAHARASRRRINRMRRAKLQLTELKYLN